MILQAADIRKSYGDLQILKGVQLSVNRGEIVSIVGRSGAGKSTLLHILGLLDKADSGALRIGDTDVAALDKRRQSAFRNQRIGFIFQFHHLLPEFTALENAAMPALIAGESKREAFRRASELLDYLGLGQRLDHKPSQLSGGEQQRAAVARALVNRPDLVLADEPTGNLDSASAQDLHRLIRRLSDEHSQTFVIVTHNKELADLSDRCLEMQDGMLTGVIK